MKLKYLGMLLAVGVAMAALPGKAEATGGSPQPHCVDLIADHNLTVGTVCVTNDEHKLYFQIQTEDGWKVKKTHVAVGKHLWDIPRTWAGKPLPWKFPYQVDSGPDGTELVELMAPLPYHCRRGDYLYIAVHVVVCKCRPGQGGIECGEVQYATSVLFAAQGTTLPGGPITDPIRIDPDNSLGATDGKFFSLGFGGGLVVLFDAPIANGPGADDILLQEVTFNRPPIDDIEKTEVYVYGNGAWHLAGEVDNTGTGLDTVAIPDGIECVDAVALIDSTDPAVSLPEDDGYDVDSIGAPCFCTGSSTEPECVEKEAWAAGYPFCYYQWGTYFKYRIQDSGDYRYDDDDD